MTTGMDEVELSLQQRHRQLEASEQNRWFGSEMLSSFFSQFHHKPAPTETPKLSTKLKELIGSLGTLDRPIEDEALMKAWQTKWDKADRLRGSLGIGHSVVADGQAYAAYMLQDGNNVELVLRNINDNADSLRVQFIGADFGNDETIRRKLSQLAKGNPALEAKMLAQFAQKGRAESREEMAAVLAQAAQNEARIRATLPKDKQGFSKSWDETWKKADEIRDAMGQPKVIVVDDKVYDIVVFRNKNAGINIDLFDKSTGRLVNSVREVAPGNLSPENMRELLATLTDPAKTHEPELHAVVLKNLNHAIQRAKYLKEELPRLLVNEQLKNLAQSAVQDVGKLAMGNDNQAPGANRELMTKNISDGRVLGARYGENYN